VSENAFIQTRASGDARYDGTNGSGSIDYGTAQYNGTGVVTGIGGQPADMMGRGGTPTDAEVTVPLEMFNNDTQSLEWAQQAPPFLDATESLRAEGWTHNYMDVIPRVFDFPGNTANEMGSK